MIELSRIAALGCLVVLALGAGACAGADGDGAGDDGATDESEDALRGRPGVNSDYCVRSPYDCEVRGEKGGGQRVGEPRSGDPFFVHGPVAVRDATGATKYTLSVGRDVILNYGQVRQVGGVTSVYALSAGDGPGWLPLSAFTDAARIGRIDHPVPTHSAGLDEMACYRVRRSSARPALAPDGSYKIEYGYGGPDGEPNDYLPRAGKDGRAYASLTFNVPGDAIGGMSIDTVPEGAKFHRLAVPVWGSTKNHLDVKVWRRNSKDHDRFTAESDLSPMAFYYGYIDVGGGHRRAGWMAADAIEPGC